MQNNVEEREPMTRLEFIKKMGLGAFLISLIGIWLPLPVHAGVPVNDNLSNGGGFVASASAPKNKKLLWIDTGNGGVAKYFIDGIWKPIRSAWGE